MVHPQCTWSSLTEQRGTYKAKEDIFLLLAVADSDANKPANFEKKKSTFLCVDEGTEGRANSIVLYTVLQKK